MSKRPVDISVLKQLVKERGALATVGFVLTVLGGLLLILLVALISRFAKPYEKYDHQLIAEQGVKKSARITYMSEVYNVTINGEHPRIISYIYKNNGSMRADKFQTLDLETIANWKMGDTITVKVFENQSAIQGIQPFSFPYYIFCIIPMILFIIGISLFIAGVWPALRRYNLYKNGDVREATVTGIHPGRRNSIVTYFFVGSNGNEIFGESTGEYALLSEKRVNDKVEIFVDSRNESRSCLVPKQRV